MIIEMARIRVLGPRRLLGDTIRALQDRGVLHLVDAACPEGLRRHEVDPIALRRRHHLTRALQDVERALELFRELGAEIGDRAHGAVQLVPAARIAGRLARELAAILDRRRALIDERDALRMFRPLFAQLDELMRADPTHRASLFLLTLRSATALETLREALERTLDGAVELRAHTAANGETLVLLAVPTSRTAEIEDLLARARVERTPLPPTLAGSSLAEALPRLAPRLAEVERSLAELAADVTSLGHRHGEDLVRARAGFHDAIAVLEAEDHAAASARAFVLEGWVPARARDALARHLMAVPEIVIEDIARDDWHGEDAPVVLSNPKLFAPFETLISLLPLPRYGTVDPTPFVAVFFPMLFGAIVGDVGYGTAIAVLALVLHLAGKRDLSRIAAAAALYSVGFGVLYGELFGDLGEHWFGMRPLWFDRKDAVLGLLVLAIALGLVHLVIGLVLAAISRWRRHRREAIGRGITAGMLVLVAVALLALFGRVPSGLLGPAVIALLIALPVVVILEGVTALFDFMTILGHVMSYARVMALGTASVMLAIVANKMHGAFGSAAIGIAFALVFHLVNFAITLFSPTIHVMRLHYVEFFGTFFEPGGGVYRPLQHWSPEATA